MATDRSLSAIRDAVTAAAPVGSVVVCGSRANGHARRDSDYDIVALMGTAAAVRHYRALKAAERKLTASLGVGVSINPLTPLAMRRARGSLFLYKVRHEGRTIYGRDVLASIDCGSVADLSPERWASFLFSNLRTLLDAARPGSSPAEGGLTGRQAEAVAKATIGFGETRLLLEGVYASAPDRVAARLAELERDGNTPAHSALAADAAASADALRSGAARLDGHAWYRARDHAASLFAELVRRLRPGSGVVDPLAAAVAYLPGAAFPKNLEFTALMLLARRGLAWRSLLSPRRVDRALRGALLCPLARPGPGGRRAPGPGAAGPKLRRRPRQRPASDGRSPSRVARPPRGGPGAVALR